MKATWKETWREGRTEAKQQRSYDDALFNEQYVKVLLEPTRKPKSGKHTTYLLTKSI